MPATNVQVGRVRRSEVFGDYGLDLFVCGDQLLRGAALNAVLIAEVRSFRGVVGWASSRRVAADVASVYEGVCRTSRSSGDVVG